MPQLDVLREMPRARYREVVGRLGAAIPFEPRDVVRVRLEDKEIVQMPEPQSGGRRSSAAPIDPMVRLLLNTVALLTIVLLASLALVLWYSGQAKPPRTAAERDLDAAEALAQSQPKEPSNWARVAIAYAKVGRHADAKRAIDRGKKAKPSAAIIYLAEANAIDLRGDHEAALKAYEVTEEKAIAEYEKRRKAAEAAGIKWDLKNDVLVETLVGKARVQVELGRKQEAVTAYDAALKIKPMMADILVDRGDLNLELGRKAEAKRDYEQALRFTPDNKRASEGLRKLDGV